MLEKITKIILVQTQSQLQKRKNLTTCSTHCSTALQITPCIFREFSGEKHWGSTCYYFWRCILPDLNLSGSCWTSLPCKQEERVNISFLLFSLSRMLFNRTLKAGCRKKRHHHFLSLTFKGSSVFPETLLMLCNLNRLLGNWHFKTHSGFWSKVLVDGATYVIKFSPWLSWCYLLASHLIILSWFSHWSASILILVHFPAKGTHVISLLFPQKKEREWTLSGTSVCLHCSAPGDFVVVHWQEAWGLLEDSSICTSVYLNSL